MGRNRNFYQNNEEAENEVEAPVVEEAVAETPVEAPVVEEVKHEPVPVVKEEPKVEIKKPEPAKEIPVVNKKPGIKYVQAKGTATL